MTHKTVALLLLFAAALLVTGMVLTGIITIVDGTVVSGPWLPVAIAVVCQTVVLFAGRRHILPKAAAERSWHVAWVLVTSVGGTLLGALVAAWTMRWFAGEDVNMPSVTLPLWLALLWWTIHRQQHRESVRRVR